MNSLLGTGTLNANIATLTGIVGVGVIFFILFAASGGVDGN